MKFLYRVLDYDGPIHCLRRWCQELQAYNLIALHRLAPMMMDVDALNRGPFARVGVFYFAFSAAIREREQNLNSLA